MKNLKILIIFLLAFCFSSCSQSVYTGTVRQTDRIKSVFTSDDFVLVLDATKPDSGSVLIFRINERLYYSIQAGEKVKIWQEPVAGAVSKVEILKK